MDKFLLVGLGNPGETYQNTRHNIGFKIIDYLAKKCNVLFNSEKYGCVAKLKVKGRQIFLLKPSTFVNLSGDSVRYHLLLKKIKIGNLLIIADDLHLPLGTIRLKKRGGDGGHNGHKDIIDKLATENYSRIKIGIDNEFKFGNQSNYVLSEWSKKELETIDECVKKTVDAIINFCTLGVDKAISDLN